MDEKELKELYEKYNNDPNVWAAILGLYAVSVIFANGNKENYVEKYFKDCKGLLNNDKGELN